jgi:hypothetical protein
MYIATVVAFEAIALKILSFEYDVHSGLSDEKAILEIMQKHTPFMKNLVFPAINLVSLCNNTKDPLNAINQIIYDETQMKDQLKAKEATAALNTNAAESFSFASTVFNWLGGVGSGIVTALGEAATGGAGALGIPVAAFIVLFSLTVYLVFFGIPTARLIIYYVNMHKVNIQKELELQAELLNNNILLLQERLEKTTDPDERIRLQNIISRQIEMLSKLQANLKKTLDSEYEASTVTNQAIEDDDKSTGAEVASSEKTEDDGSSGGYSIDI